MKTLILLTMGIVFLAACSNPATATATATETETPLPTQTQLPTPTLTQTALPTPAGLKYCVKTGLLNMRSGPGTQYSVVAILANDTCGLVSGRNEDASWGYMATNKFTGWVFVKYLSGTGDIKSLPVLTVTTPTPNAASPIPSASPTTSR